MDAKQVQPKRMTPEELESFLATMEAEWAGADVLRAHLASLLPPTPDDVALVERIFRTATGLGPRTPWTREEAVRAHATLTGLATSTTAPVGLLEAVVKDVATVACEGAGPADCGDCATCEARKALAAYDAAKGGDALPSVDTLCEVMHDAYEQAATANGWETQARSRKPWADVPEANKATMRVAVAALLRTLGLTK